MAGRQSRARLLAPSFLLMGAAVACGGTHIGGESSEKNGGGCPAGVVCNPQPPAPGQGGHAGAVAIPGPEGGSGGTFGGVGGTFGFGGAGGAIGGCPAGVACNPPPRMVPCPETVPPEGAQCAAAFVFQSPPECHYASPNCGEVIARCIGTAYWTTDSCGAGGQPGVGGADDGGAGAPGQATGGVPAEIGGEAGQTSVGGAGG